MAVGTAVAVVATVSLSTLALASTDQPKGEYKQFADCPLGRKTLNDCIYSVSRAGSFKIGRKVVEIQNPVTLQGGFEGGGEKIKFFGAEGGATLSKTPQPVAGGLKGVAAPSWWPAWLQEWFDEEIRRGETAVTATLELAGPATAIALNTENLLFEEGTALGLPAKIRLENALLGPNCQIGSDEHPLQIDLATGKSGALEGAVSPPQFNKKFTLTTINGGRLVNGSFTAPAANGCGGVFSYFFDPLVDSILGTPSEAGQNSAILEGTFQDAATSAVKEASK